ncbi:MAG: 2-hydroxyacyl-CoA dehydratase family protein [Desulfatiglans sp.]|nr:2-hydroxyacyl-CoA dehydratase family protein [Thermodesulfobacteriota bacterium]MEE4351737.1 2-hydroxyacyl-CoA dehydratase family protein [Desulfatiglans sp.]
MAADLSKMADSILNPFVENWKKQGKPVLGFTCSYVPKEIIHAAGILPYRIRARGSGERTMGDVRMSQITCPFSRSILELALKGEYNFLDGLVSMNSCECMRRMCDNWVSEIGADFFHFLSVPYKSSAEAVEWFRHELDILRENLEKSFDVTVTDENLRDSVNTYNKTRKLLRKLYDLRKEKNPKISWSEIQRVVVMSSAMPIEEYNTQLESLIDEVESRNGINNYRARLMLIGTPLDNPSNSEAIEDLGGLVVTDLSCFGTISFWDPFDSDGDPLDIIAKGYLNDSRCPRMPGRGGERHNLIKEMAESFDIDGIVFERMMFCNIWGGETMSLEKDMKELNIPMLIIDSEYAPGSEGQIGTRVEAFLEMIEGRAK